MSNHQSSLIKPLIVAAILAFLTALLGGLLTTIGPWFDDLTKPTWQPPDWLFGPVWTALYTLCAISAALAWRAAPERTDKLIVTGLFLGSAALNVLWSALFFYMQRPDLAVWECALLLALIIALILGVARYSRLSAWLLLPYLAWVSFALLLNFAIVRLNGPFA